MPMLPGMPEQAIFLEDVIVGDAAFDTLAKS